jgi:hypothetical protein
MICDERDSVPDYIDLRSQYQLRVGKDQGGIASGGESTRMALSGTHDPKLRPVLKERHNACTNWEEQRRRFPDSRGLRMRSPISVQI